MTKENEEKKKIRNINLLGHFSQQIRLKFKFQLRIQRPILFHFIFWNDDAEYLLVSSGTRLKSN